MPRREDDRDDARGGPSRRAHAATARVESRPHRSGVSSRERRTRRDKDDDGARPSRSEARRGFAAMDPEERREISRRGGKASHERGRGHEWSEDEAREYGREGGRVAHDRGTAHEWSSREAREAGREGARARWGSDADQGEYCPECGRGGRVSRGVSRSTARVDEDDDGGRRVRGRARPRTRSSDDD